MTMRVGLTGGIGSGKSTVARELQSLGAHLVDTDAIARRLTQSGGAAIPALRNEFGDRCIDVNGAMDREQMRGLILNDPDAKQRLEALLHPLIRAQCDAEANQAAPGQTVVFDVPLLVESGGWLERVNRVLVVDCSPETQVRRVVARSGWSEAQVRQVIAQQASRQSRLAVANDVILNDGMSLDALTQSVRALWQQWQASETRPLAVKRL